MARKSASSGSSSSSTSSPVPSGSKVNRNRLMPGLRVRRDGWTEERTQRFFDALAHTGCARDAARVAGVSNTAAYRMKRRFSLFSGAWDRALARAGEGLVAVAYKRAVEGKETIIIRGGQEVERRITPSDVILGLLLKRRDMTGNGLIGGKTPDDYLSFDKWQQDKRFDENGRKIEIENLDDAKERYIAQLVKIRALKQLCGDGWIVPDVQANAARRLVQPVDG